MKEVLAVAISFGFSVAFMTYSVCYLSALFMRIVDDSSKGN